MNMSGLTRLSVLYLLWVIVYRRCSFSSDRSVALRNLNGQSSAFSPVLYLCQISGINSFRNTLWDARDKCLNLFQIIRISNVWIRVVWLLKLLTITIDQIIPYPAVLRSSFILPCDFCGVSCDAEWKSTKDVSTERTLFLPLFLFLFLLITTWSAISRHMRHLHLDCLKR